MALDGRYWRILLNRVTNCEFHNSRQSADYIAVLPFQKEAFCSVEFSMNPVLICSPLNLQVA